MTDKQTTQTQTSRDVLVREIDSTLALVDADTYTRAYAILKLIERGNDNDRPALLQHVAHTWEHAKPSGEHKAKSAIDDTEKQELESKYGKVVDSLLDLEISANPSEVEFYTALDRLIQNPVFANEKARAFALYWVLIDRRTPYFQLGEGLHLSNEDFKALGNKLRRELAELRFITVVKHEQRSQEADRVLKVLDRCDGPERIRLMAGLMFELRDQGGKQATQEIVSRLPAEVREFLF